jgi:hypothetical protein
MIRWTAAGAVPTPTTVQIRVQRSYPGRIRAGAPVPTRSMSREELLENLRYFTEGLNGPRTQPCTGLVLSGVGVASRPDIPEAITVARSLGIDWIVLHVGGEDLGDLEPARFVGLVDTLVTPVQPETGALVNVCEVITQARAQGLRVAANTVLTANALPALARAARPLAKAAPDTMTFTYPFPINGNEATSAPNPGRAMSALRPALATLDRANVKVQIKGLPACHLGPDAHRLGRTSNRYYVDADHQRGQALVFFPDVVRFHKDDACRFCSLDEACDGFFSTYLRRPGFPPLSPVDTEDGEASADQVS